MTLFPDIDWPDDLEQCPRCGEIGEIGSDLIVWVSLEEVVCNVCGGQVDVICDPKVMEEGIKRYWSKR